MELLLMPLRFRNLEALKVLFIQHNSKTKPLGANSLCAEGFFVGTLNGPRAISAMPLSEAVFCL